MTSSIHAFAAPVGALVIAALSFGAARSAAAQSTDRAAPPAHFAPMAFLAESCWKGAFPDNVATDEHCFTWVYGKQFLRDKHIVRNGKTPYEGETMYALDVAAKQVSYVYWSSDGNTMRGTVESRRRQSHLPHPLRHSQGSDRDQGSVDAPWARPVSRVAGAESG